MKKVIVLLSSYNGQEYLREQLDSILNQSYGNIELLVRDDGSTDDTLSILEEYQSRGCLLYYKGENLGVRGSFFELLRLAPAADYYSFSDQDDIWLPDKIQRAVTRLDEESTDEYLVYGSNLKVIDARRQFIKYGKKIRKLSYQNALMENVLGGLTMVINKKTRDRILRVQNTRQIYLHDWYLYLLGAFLGKVIYDEMPTVLYRQHERNQLGAGQSRLAEIRRKVTLFKQFHTEGYIYKNALNFYKNFGQELSPEQEGQLKYFLNARTSFPKRLRWILAGNVYRQSRAERVCYVVLFALGLL